MHIDLIPCCNLVKGYILQQLIITLSEWGISFHDNVILLAKLDCLFINVERVAFNLVNYWMHGAEMHQLFKMSNLEVTHASSCNLLLIHCFLESLPASMAIFDIDRVVLIGFLSTWP